MFDNYLKKRKIIALNIVFLCAVFSVPMSFAEKVTIGAIEEVHIQPANIPFIGRVDTGAKTTSIHAHVIEAVDGKVRFTIENVRGETSVMSMKIVRQSLVKSADAKEWRYFVWLRIEFAGRSKRVLVNLNDRAASRYKLLLGRNWLAGDFIVDVEH